MIIDIKNNCRIYSLIIVKSTKKSLMLDYGFSNATFETPNHAFAHLSFEINQFQGSYWSSMVIYAHFQFKNNRY